MIINRVPNELFDAFRFYDVVADGGPKQAHISSQLHHEFQMSKGYRRETSTKAFSLQAQCSIGLILHLKGHFKPWQRFTKNEV